MNFHLKGMSHLEKVVNYTPIVCQTVEDVLLNMFVIFSQKILRIYNIATNDLRRTPSAFIAFAIVSC